MASLTANAKPRLVLHFDVNETIMVADPAGGDSFEDVLNKMLAKTAFVRRKDGGVVDDAASPSDLEWRDGVPLDDDSGDPEQALWLRWEKPDDGSKMASTTKCLEAHRKTFTETFKRFGGIKQELAARLRLPPGRWDPCFCTDDGKHHRFLPAFFETLRVLLDAGRDVSLVIRTFGSDGPTVALALRAWIAGRHPTVKAPQQAPNWVQRDRVFAGKYDAEGRYTLTPPLNDDGRGACLDEGAAVALLEEPRSATVIRDDYAWWAKHDEAPAAGKPFWITRGSNCHHIFFDDHIRNSDRKSIVAARCRSSPTDAFVALDGPATRTLHGAYLVRVPTLLPVRDRRWFLDRIAECERRRAELLGPLLA